MTAAKCEFDRHIAQCTEALAVYDFLHNQRYQADFGLRYVWVAAISALDHYVTQFIIEKATEQFDRKRPFTPKLLGLQLPVSAHLSMNGVTPAERIVEFRKQISLSLQFRTFQKADDVADGLAFVWNENDKWNKISKIIGLKSNNARHKLNSIARRRDLIVHNADYDPATGALLPCERTDAKTTVQFIQQLVQAIDIVVP